LRPKSPFGGHSFSFRDFVLLDELARKQRGISVLEWLIDQVTNGSGGIAGLLGNVLGAKK
jgi:hypothetical protein